MLNEFAVLFRWGEAFNPDGRSRPTAHLHEHAAGPDVRV